jgi:hypothetical protein
MGKGRPHSQFELLTERPGFRATPEQIEWLRAASIDAGDVSLSEWLRRVAIEAGEKQLGTSFPRRKLMTRKKAR